MFRSLHTSSSVVHIKSTVNIQIIKGFMGIKANIMNKTIKNLNINY